MLLSPFFRWWCAILRTCDLEEKVSPDEDSKSQVMPVQVLIHASPIQQGVGIPVLGLIKPLSKVAQDGMALKHGEGANLYGWNLFQWIDFLEFVSSMLQFQEV